MSIRAELTEKWAIPRKLPKTANFRSALSVLQLAVITHTSLTRKESILSATELTWRRVPVARQLQYSVLPQGLTREILDCLMRLKSKLHKWGKEVVQNRRVLNCSISKIPWSDTLTQMSIAKQVGPCNWLLRNYRGTYSKISVCTDSKFRHFSVWSWIQNLAQVHCSCTTLSVRLLRRYRGGSVKV
jgi:hypothetical protein